MDLEGEYPVRVPLFMKEIVEQMTVEARKSPFIDHASGVSARFSIANYRTMIASARRRAAILMRASCVEFVLAGLYACEQRSRTARHGTMRYEL